jgi:hypothetical protein
MALIGSINAPNNFGFKNRIINGAIGIWQRGTSFTSGGSATYTADRFFGNASSGTISRSTDVPAGFTYSFSNAASSTAYPGIAQRIESVNIADCASQAITVSFWVKQTSGTASALNINLAYPTAVDNYASSTTIIETNVVATMTASWTQYSYTYTLPANVTNGLSVILFIPNASITATFLITGIQVEKGSTATSFDYRPYGTELALCQRYYEDGYYSARLNGTIIRQAWPFVVQKRGTPTINVYYDSTKPTAGTINKSNTTDSGWTPGGNAWMGNMEKNTGSQQNGTDYGWYWTAAIEL